MKAYLICLLCVFSLGLYAADINPVTTPTAAMQSVNNASYMNSGSTYTPMVYEVGSYSPSESNRSAVSGKRKAGGPGSTGGKSDYDPNNPQFSPLGDALIPLLIMAFIYALRVLYKRKFFS